MKNTKTLNEHDAGYVMVCIMSDVPAFQVGKKYITETSSIKIGGQGCPDINGGWSLNYQRYRYYGVEGVRGIYAKFVMLKDNKGRYVKHDTQGRHVQKMRRNGKTDPRRFRRYVRQLMKTPMSPFEQRVFGRLVRRGL
jgi:hypothetical protein|nr:MAG TPA: hypothetical protein [Caudoviricetes sp.]